MNTENVTKINRLLQTVPSGIVLQASWLTGLGYSPELQKYYRNSGWLKSWGTGAMVRSNDQPGFEGGVYALQNQSRLFIHPGGRTALALLGKAHYLELNTSQVWLFGGQEESLPSWFRNHPWPQKVNYKATSFLPPEKGLTELPLSGFSIKVSSAARAIMECLYLAPDKFDLMECFELMENLNDLRPQQVQELLEVCTSVKVKRLFLFMAEKLNHNWFRYINLTNIDLGKGKRSLVKGGTYIPKYQITVPPTLAKNDQ